MAVLNNHVCRRRGFCSSSSGRIEPDIEVFSVDPPDLGDKDIYRSKTICPGFRAIFLPAKARGARNRTVQRRSLKMQRISETNGSSKNIVKRIVLDSEMSNVSEAELHLQENFSGIYHFV
jgi:BRCT domain type II-containing protein